MVFPQQKTIIEPGEVLFIKQGSLRPKRGMGEDSLVFSLVALITGYGL